MPADRGAPMQLDRDPAGDVVLTLSGEIDIEACDELRRHLVLGMQHAIESGSRFVLDLGEVAFMDSTGVNAVLHTARQLMDRGLTLVVARPSRIVSRVLEVTGANQLLAIEP